MFFITTVRIHPIIMLTGQYPSFWRLTKRRSSILESVYNNEEVGEKTALRKLRLTTKDRDGSGTCSGKRIL